MEYVVFGFQTRRRPSDSDPHAHELGRAERGGDRSHAAIAGIATAAFEPELARLEIDFVVHNDQPLGGKVRVDVITVQHVVGQRGRQAVSGAAPAV